MTRFLVTGGSGFIGTHLVEALLARGDMVVNVDVARPTLPGHAPYWRNIDLMDQASIASLVADFQPEAIINLAAIADLQKGREAMQVNTIGLLNLLEATKDFARKPRLVHASTQLVVGPGEPVTGPRDYAPYTPYGESKAESEQLLWDWPGAIEWSVIRPTLVWGAYYPTFARATWYYLQRRWYFVPSRNSAIKTFSYVESLVHQMLRAAELPGERVNRKIFYGGDEVLDSAIWLDAFSRALTGKAARRLPYAGLQLLAAGGDLSAKLGGPSPINSGRLFRMTQDYPTPIDETLQILGRSSHSLEQGVATTVAWLRDAYPGKFPRR